MTGRRTTAGLSLLCALLVCAFAAQSASAAKAVNTTAFTCVKGSGNIDFKDAHCNEKVAAGTGEYGHVAIENNTTRGITFRGHLALKGKLIGLTIELTCELHITGSFHNVASSGNHTLTAQVKLKLKCTLSKPSKCVVNEPIEGAAVFEGVEGLGPEKNTMGLEFKPEVGGTLFEVTFKNKGAESCALNNKTFPVSGTAIATGTPTPTEKHSGATAVFTHAMTAETLFFGGEKAGIESTTEVMSEEGTSIALTTVT